MIYKLINNNKLIDKRINHRKEKFNCKSYRMNGGVKKWVLGDLIQVRQYILGIWKESLR